MGWSGTTYTLVVMVAVIWRVKIVTVAEEADGEGCAKGTVPWGSRHLYPVICSGTSDVYEYIIASREGKRLEASKEAFKIHPRESVGAFDFPKWEGKSNLFYF